MMRFCPNCQTERSLHEIFCEGHVGSAPCGWDLSIEAIQESGWRPKPIVTAEHVPPADQSPGTAAVMQCPNGHDLAEGDLLCMVCGELAVPPRQEDESAPSAVHPHGDETVIDHWRLMRQTGGNVACEYFDCTHVEDGRQATLTLYRAGAEPDPAVYEVLAGISYEHVPVLFAAGRWNDRAYEVNERFDDTLVDLGIVIDDVEKVRHVVWELGMAFEAFNEAGLRHRDLHPGVLYVRRRAPLDMVVGGFGSARLSSLDLEIAAPLEITRYMAPEAIAGGVAAASDWWSLGIILLEQLTAGGCFEGIHPHAWLIHVLSTDVALPDGLDPSLKNLLRGLLNRDRHRRWQWKEVKDWLEGRAPLIEETRPSDDAAEEGSVITLAHRNFRKPALFALAAAEAENWDEARELFCRGAVTTWAIGKIAEKSLQGLRKIGEQKALSDDFRLMLALRLLNPVMPLILRGEIVTSRWLLEHPVEGYALIHGKVPSLLEKYADENWLSGFRSRERRVRRRARDLDIDLDEETLRIALLSNSQARLAAQWDVRRKIFPDASVGGLASLMERPDIGEEDLIVLLSAHIGQFRACDVIVEEAKTLAAQHDILAFAPEEASRMLLQTRQALYRLVEERTAGFARCGVDAVDGWVEQFRLERRMPLDRMLVTLAIPPEQWLAAHRQQYVEELIAFFEKRLTAAVMRGPLVRMTIGRMSHRIDLAELSARTLRAGHKETRDEERAAADPHAELLMHILQRSASAKTIDPACFDDSDVLAYRMRQLLNDASLYRRDTGIDGLYLGFPFLLIGEPGSTVRRVAPVLLFPVRLSMEIGRRNHATLSFDKRREAVRLNPAFEKLFGSEEITRWRQAADDLVGRSALTPEDVMNRFGEIVEGSHIDHLRPLPAIGDVQPDRTELVCSAVLFNVAFMGQSIREDLHRLKALSPGNTALAAMLRIENETPGQPDPPQEEIPEQERYFTAISDPSQASAVMQARSAPGLLIEGPPGTGKSQTIVDMVCDAIGRGKTLLIICQKYAALEVVHKRLQAEGLDERVIMVSDINQDRVPVIRSVRAQLEKVFGDADASSAWHTEREALAARIDALEAELDAYHEQTRACDVTLGMSYLSLMRALITLENPERPFEVPRLRSVLIRQAPETIDRIERDCASMASVWLSSKFEDSPLASLRPFSTDLETLELFEKIFRRFEQIETERLEKLKTLQSGFDVDDPAPYQRWLKEYGQRFMNLDRSQRKVLAKGWRLFHNRQTGAKAGESLIRSLTEMQARLARCRFESFSARLSPLLCTMPKPTLDALYRQAEKVTRRSLFSRVNPLNFFRRRRLYEFLSDHGYEPTPKRIEVLGNAVELELSLRPFRHALGKTHQMLGLESIPRDMIIQLPEELRLCVEMLEEARDLGAAILQAPDVELFEPIIRSGRRSQIKRLFSGLHAAILRHGIRKRSLDMLQALDDWIDGELYEALNDAIHCNQDTLERLRAISSALPTLEAYQRFRSFAVRTEPAVLDVFSVLRSHKDIWKTLPAEALGGALSRSIRHEFYLAWKYRFERKYPGLAVDRAELALKISELAEADRQMRAMNRDMLAENVDRSALGTKKNWEDITRLTGARARRLREFVELGVDRGLLRLRPVWLLNPDIASQLLPLRPSLFDTVVYDEASQMPVEFALPTLFRARTVIVSGDEKQLPPTAFFSSRVENDEAELCDGIEAAEDEGEDIDASFGDGWNKSEIKDCPHLLQLARGALPSKMLEIHYRSASRELIEFSNVVFYANRLNIPVPYAASGTPETLPLELVSVDGQYQQQTNEEEARAVIALLEKIWRASPERRPSVGVVTFNRRQAQLIEQKIVERTSENKAFLNAYLQERDRTENGESMGFFVKNVENVQGDERDVIVFSTTFGRNPHGVFKRQFGVLGQRGGEQRLNVAVTRARRKIFLMSSIPIEDVSDLLATSRPLSGPRDYLQAYLEYARLLTLNNPERVQALLDRLSDAPREKYAETEWNDGFVRQVAEFMRAEGWPVRLCQRDGNVFGIDFMIEDPKTQLPLVGIECDAPDHPLLTRARAREIWRRMVLQRVAPALHCVSSIGWQHDPEREKNRLRHAIESALAEPQ